MINTEDKALAIHSIQRHEFESAKRSLQEYTSKTQAPIGLPRVPTGSGPFGLFPYTVTGSNLNEVTSQIQDYLLKINRIHQGMLDEFKQVYNALDALDHDYIAAILDSIKAIEEIYQKVKNNQKDISDIIDQQAIIIQALSLHKEKLEQLEHIMDVDKAWMLIEELSVAVQSLEQHRDELAQLNHLKDMDTLWDNTEELQGAVNAINQTLADMSKTLDSQDKFNNEISEDARLLQQSQYEGFNEIHLTIAEHKLEFNKQLETLDQSHQAQLELIRTTMNETDLAFREQLASSEQAHQENMDRLVLSLSEEKATLTEQLSSMTQQLKIAYFIAGGAAAVSVIHIVLNALGII